VYDEYTFIISEPKRLEEFLDKKPLDMDEVLERITLYEDTIESIRNKMPYEIRMSMFLVECEYLNNKLVGKCEDLMRTIFNAIAEYVQITLTAKVQNDVKHIEQNFAIKPETTKQLVEA